MSPDQRPTTAREIAALLSDASAEEVRVLVERYSEDPRRQVRHAVEVASRRMDREKAEHGHELVSRDDLAEALGFRSRSTT